MQSGRFSYNGDMWHCRLDTAGDHPDGGRIHNQGIVSPATTELGWFACGSPGCAMSLPLGLPRFEVGSSVNVKVEFGQVSLSKGVGHGWGI